MSDQEIVRRHRTIWGARPELRAVYEEWFAQLLRCVEGLRPIVEIEPAIRGPLIVHGPAGLRIEFEREDCAAQHQEKACLFNSKFRASWNFLLGFIPIHAERLASTRDS